MSDKLQYISVTYNRILEKKPKEWDYDFCDYVYDEIEKLKI